MKLRLVTALLVRCFDVELAAGETGDDVFDNMVDSFTVSPGPLKLVSEQRKYNYQNGT